MKKILFFVLSIVCASLISSAAITQTDINQNLNTTCFFPENVKVLRTPKNNDSVSSVSRFFVVRQNNDHEKKSTRSETVTILPELLNGINLIVAIGRDGRVYVGETDYQTWETALTLPEGTYDLVGIGYGPNNSFIAISKTNVDIEFGTSLVFDGNDTNYNTTIKNYSPLGEELVLPSNWDDPEKYCAFSAKFIMVLYNNQFISYAPIVGTVSEGSDVLSNFSSGPFSVEIAESIYSKEGVMNTLIQVDFSKREMGSSSSGWQIAETKFADTKISKPYLNYLNSHELPEQGCSYFSLLNSDEWLGTMGGIVEGEFATKTGRICFWRPKEYKGPFELLGYPGSTVVFKALMTQPGGILGLPFKAGEEHPEIMGFNYASLMESVTDKYLYTFKSVFPFYKNRNSEILLGNCAPMLYIAPKDQKSFTFNFIGRYGEIFDIDTWYDSFGNVDPGSAVNPELLTELGFPTNTIEVKFDGETLTENRADFPYGINWNQSGVFEIKVETNNVLINNQVEGYTKGSVIFDSRKNRQAIPTLSSFQVVNKNNEEVNDLLTNPSDGFIRMFAGDFKSQWNNQYYYYYLEISDIDNVTVEYSPTGLGEYQPLEVTKGDLFITPGFGREFTADLSSINRLGTDGWFDIRVTVEDAYGSKQVQEICPALNIASMAGAKTVSVESDKDVEYFNLQGLRIGTPQHGTLVIERKHTGTRKVMIQ